MAESRVKYTLWNRILNINSSELPLVAMCFLVRFFHRFGFVVGWTVIVALLVSNYGIEYLPYLFIANGLFIIASGTFYSRFVRTFKNSSLIIWTVAIACLMIFLTTFLIQKNTIFLFLILVFAESFLLFQLNILISAFVERFFTPLSCQRTFPLIESADTIAMLLAGVILVAFAETLSPHKFFYIWIFSLLPIIPVVLGSNLFCKRCFKKESPCGFSDKKSFFAILTDSIARSRKLPFLGMLVVIILAQWIFISLMEFQYTKAVSASVISGFSVPNAVSSYEHALVHTLGSLQVLFGGSALLVQILIGSRIITSLGIISSMLLYPVVAFLSLIGLTMNFSYLTGVLARNNTEMTNVLFKNSYHAAFYVLRDKTRELSREFLEGFVRPFAAVTAMSIIVFLQLIFKGGLLQLSTNILLFIVAIIMFVFILSARKKYTEAAAAVLFKDDATFDEKLHAVEILAQKGHKSVPIILSGALKSKKTDIKLKKEIVRLIGDSEKKDRLPLLLDTLDTDSRELLLIDLNVLSDFAPGDIVGSFTEHRFLTTLISLFQKETDLDIKVATLQNIANFDSKEAAAFILNALNDPDDHVKAETLCALKKYSDISITCYVEPFLASENPELKAYACVALWRFHSFKTRILSLFSDMMSSGKCKDVVAAISAIAEIGIKDYRKKFNQLMNSKDFDVSMHAAYGLAKLGYLDSCERLAHLLLDDNKLVSQRVHKLLQKVPKKVLKHIYRIKNDVH